MAIGLELILFLEIEICINWRKRRSPETETNFSPGVLETLFTCEVSVNLYLGKVHRCEVLPLLRAALEARKYTLRLHGS